MAIQPNGTAVYIIKPHEQLYHGGFSGTSRADNGDLLSRLYRCAEIVNDALLRLIAKGNVLKINAALDIFQLYRMFCTGCLFGFFQEFKNTLCCSRHRLYLIEHLCNLLHGLGKVLYILDKRLNVTNGNGSAAYPRFPTNIIIGCIRPDRNWDFQAE